MILVGAAILHPIFAGAQSPTPTPPAYTVTITALTTSFGGPKPVTPTAKFGQTIGAGNVVVDYRVTGVTCPDDRTSPFRIVEFDLLEDGVAFDFDYPPCDSSHRGNLSYVPALP